MRFLSYRQPNGHWGIKFYQPKWKSTHYTLLDLKNLCISPEVEVKQETLRTIFSNEKGPDGGILPIGKYNRCDVCVNGMVLNYASYFRLPEILLHSVVDFLLAERMPDGAFNCASNTVGATHSSMHTTLSVLEGIHEYQSNGYTYRLYELLDAQNTSQEFLLMHRLFRSHKTGQVIKPAFLKLRYPCRWYYDILKALNYFQESGAPYDERMQDALDMIVAKRTKGGYWKLASPHRGQMYFEMDKH